MPTASNVCELSSLERRQTEYISAHTKTKHAAIRPHSDRMSCHGGLEGLFCACVRKHETVLLAHRRNAGLTRCFLWSYCEFDLAGRAWR